MGSGRDDKPNIGTKQDKHLNKAQSRSHDKNNQLKNSLVKCLLTFIFNKGPCYNNVHTADNF